MISLFLFLCLYTASYRGKEVTLTTKEFAGFHYIDIKPISELIGDRISHLEKSRRFFWHRKDNLIVFVDGSHWVLIDGKPYNLPLPIESRDDNLFLPISKLSLLLSSGFGLQTDIGDNQIKIYEGRRIIETIVIDPGHGGRDPGAVGLNKTLEKDIVLEIALMTARKLEKAGINCILTRDTDIFIPLMERTQIANQSGADLFVSIHLNAYTNRDVNGAEVFFLSPARTDWERAVEARENSVIEFEERPLGEDLETILWDLAQTEHLSESKRLSAYILESILKKTKVESRGVKQANFFVLRGAYMPSVLVEVDFLSHPKLEKRFNCPDFQRKAALGITDGIKQFKLAYEKEMGYE